MPTPNFNKLKQGPSAGTKSVASATLAFAGSQRPDTVVPKIAEQEIFLSAIQEREENTFALINIDSLADSIYDYGLIEPISVWKKDSDFSGKYTISAGHRRFKAFQTLHEKYPEDERFSAIPARAYIVTENPDLLAQGGKYISLEQEKGMYLDSNFETRQVSYNDALTYIDYLIDRIEKNSADQLKAIEMQEANRAEIQRHSKKINRAEFISQMIAEQNYDKWSVTNTKKYLAIREKSKTDPEAAEYFKRIHLPEDDPNHLIVSAAYAKVTGKDRVQRLTNVRVLLSKAEAINREIQEGRILTAHEKKALGELQKTIEDWTK